MNIIKEKDIGRTNTMRVRLAALVTIALAGAIFLAACENNMETEDLSAVASVESLSRNVVDGNPKRIRDRNLSRDDFLRWAEERGLSKEDFSRRREWKENHRTEEGFRQAGEWKHHHRRFGENGERRRRREQV